MGEGTGTTAVVGKAVGTRVWGTGVGAVVAVVGGSVGKVVGIEVGIEVGGDGDGDGSVRLTSPQQRTFATVVSLCIHCTFSLCPLPPRPFSATKWFGGHAVVPIRVEDVQTSFESNPQPV